MPTREARAKLVAAGAGEAAGDAKRPSRSSLPGLRRAVGAADERQIQPEIRSRLCEPASCCPDGYARRRR